MYVNIGSASDTCEQGAGAKPPTGYPFPCPEAEDGSPRGGIRKYVLDGPDHLGGAFTTIAKGLRNSMALAVHPTSNLLIQGENSRDSINKLDASLTDQEGDLPHEELNVITEGAHYGWPYCIDNGTPNPEYRGRVDCTHYKNPALLLPGHVAPLGMAFYTGSMFPAAYQNQLIVTFHGYREYGHRLMLVPVDAQGVPGVGEPMDIIRGWEKSADGKDPQGAPVDVVVAKDGSLFVTEDKNGDVLRVFFDAHLGDGAPMKPLPPQKPGRQRGREGALRRAEAPHRRVLARAAGHPRHLMRRLSRRGSRLRRRPRDPEVRRGRQRAAPPRGTSRRARLVREAGRREQRARPAPEGAGLPADARGRRQPRAAPGSAELDPRRSADPALRTDNCARTVSALDTPTLYATLWESAMKTWNSPQATEIKMDAEISSYQDDSYDPQKDGPLFAQNEAAETDLSLAQRAIPRA